MSWQVQFIGSPENVAKALEAESLRLSDQSKEEFDAALPHMVGLVKENFSPSPIMVKLTALGHGYSVDGEAKDRLFSITLERMYGTIV